MIGKHEPRRKSRRDSGFFNVVQRASTSKSAPSNAGLSPSSQAPTTPLPFIKSCSKTSLDGNSTARQPHRGSSSWCAASSLLAKRECVFYRAFVPRAAVCMLLDQCHARQAVTELVSEEINTVILIIDTSGFTKLCDRFQVVFQLPPPVQFANSLLTTGSRTGRNCRTHIIIRHHLRFRRDPRPHRGVGR